MSTPSDGSDRSDQSNGSHYHRTLRPHGGYRRLHSFQVTPIIYDATVAFCDRFVDKRSRTRDQMVQTARSGRQNIAEGSRASATSSQAEALAVRQVGQQHQSDQTDPTNPSDQASPYAQWLQHRDPAVVANTLICLIHQANYLLDQQIRALEQEFIQGGGYREQLHAARLEARSRQAPSGPSTSSNPSDQPHLPLPACPQCGQCMVLRTAHKGPHVGSRFWDCTAYPTCKGTRPAQPEV